MRLNLHAFNYDLIITVSQRLAEVLHHQAILLEHIIHEPRYYADYFRVAFYGDFPDAIRDKEFIVSCRLLHVCSH